MSKKLLKLLITTILLTALIIFSTYATIVPESARAAEITNTTTVTTKAIPPFYNSTATNSSNISGNFFGLNDGYETQNIPSLPSSRAQQQSLSLLNNVVGLNSASYITSLNCDNNESYRSVSQERIEYAVVSNQSSMRVACSFINNNLHQIYMSDWTGPVYLKHQDSTELEMTKGFLQSYQSFSENTFYGILGSMLSDVKPNENTTKIFGNISLKVTVHSQGTMSFVWTYVDQNGVSAPSKDVVLSYDQGRLQCFLDNWQLYEVEGIPQVSAQDATTIALSSTQNFSYTVSSNDGRVFSVSNFKVVGTGSPVMNYLNYLNATEARGGDPFTLYPSWYIPVEFDKVYSGDVTGVIVRVWADTGEVNNISPMVFETAPNKELAVSQAYMGVFAAEGIVVLLIVGAVMFFTSYVAFTRSKKLIAKLWVVLLLCMLTSVCFMAESMQGVSATPNSKAEIYASTHKQNETEIPWESYIINDIASYFNTVGYDYSTYNGTNSATVYANIENDQENYERVAIFHFGHMAGPATYYGNSDNDIIYHNTVDQHTNGYTDKHFFVFLWSCFSADNNASSLPSASPDPNYMAQSWTQRANLNIDGYHNDNGPADCFIGFNGSSPGLGFTIFENSYVYGYEFIDRFYYRALVQGHYSVHDALNQASYDLFNDEFDNSPLYTGYNTWWPGSEEAEARYYHGQMYVYGNSNIFLAQYYPYLFQESFNYNNGAANYVTALLGKAPDDSYTQLWGGNRYDGGSVVSLTTDSLGAGGGYARGHIYVYGYSVNGYFSHLHVYVAQVYAEWAWYEVNDLYIDSSTPGWIDVGVAPIDFKYIAVVGYNDAGWSCNLWVDSVRIIP
jgi:hypothetical protein